MLACGIRIHIAFQRQSPPSPRPLFAIAIDNSQSNSAPKFQAIVNMEKIYCTYHSVSTTVHCTHFCFVCWRVFASNKKKAAIAIPAFDYLLHNHKMMPLCAHPLVSTSISLSSIYA